MGQQNPRGGSCTGIFIQLAGWLHQNKTRLPLGCLVFSTYLVVWFSSNSIRPYWTDEIFSIWTSGGGRLTWSESLFQIAEGKDGMMPAFYFLSTAWEKFLGFLGIFDGGVSGGESEIWLRLPSLIWTLLGFGVLYAFLKRRYGISGAAVGVSIGMLCTVAAGQEMQWVRAYAPMVAWTCLLVVFAGIQRGRTRTFLLYLACLALTLFHPYGFLYGGAVIGTLVLVEISRRNWREGIVTGGAMALPLVAMLLNFDRLVAVKNLGGEGGMWPTPGLESFLFAVAPLSNPLLAALVLMLCGVAGAFRVVGVAQGEGEGTQGGTREFSLATISLIAVPLFIWIFSQWDSFFIIRYFSPSIVGVSIMSCWTASRVLGRGSGWWAFLCVTMVCLSYLAGGLVMGEDRLRKSNLNRELKGLEDMRFLQHEGEDLSPLVIEDLDLFLPRIFYNPQEYYFFPIRELSVEEPGFRDKALAQNLVLAHARSHQETGGRVGIDPRSLLDRGRLGEVMDASERIFILTNQQKGTGGFVEKELSSRGWTRTVLVPGQLVVWVKGGGGGFDLWYGTRMP